jgi:hypothetical protein
MAMRDMGTDGWVDWAKEKGDWWMCRSDEKGT